MIIGFTGTSHGMTPEQLRAVFHLFQQMPLDTLHYGCCVGADAQAHALALKLGARIVGHPPKDQTKMADLAGFHQLWHQFPYLERNRHIIEQAAHGVVAAPRGFIEPASLRGEGTWTTVGYARQAGRMLWLVQPDGVVRTEQPQALIHKGG